MSAANGNGGKDGRALVVGPLAMPGFLLVLMGVRRRRPVFVLLGAVLVGLAVKLVDRGPATAAEQGAAAEAPEPEPSAEEPHTDSEASSPGAPKAPKPRASAAPPAARPAEPEVHTPEPDQADPA